LAELGVARLELWTETNNVRSQHVAERSGFIREGVLRSFREVEGRRFDAILYSLLPSDPLH
jgi:RimJ/RimL family protein N-acetyltransferase